MCNLSVIPRRRERRPDISIYVYFMLLAHLVLKLSSHGLFFTFQLEHVEKTSDSYSRCRRSRPIHLRGALSGRSIHGDSSDSSGKCHPTYTFSSYTTFIPPAVLTQLTQNRVTSPYRCIILQFIKQTTLSLHSLTFLMSLVQQP